VTSVERHLGQLRILGVLLAALLLGAACGGNSPEPANKPTATAAGPSVTPTSSESSPTPSATPTEVTLTSPRPYPQGTQVGIPAVDSVLKALEAPTPDALEALFVETPAPAPCVINPQGIHSPPLCPAGVASGSLVPVFRATACESVWPDSLQRVLTGPLWTSPRPLLAIYRNPTDAYSWLPAADYAIIIHTLGNTESRGWPAVIRVQGDHVNGIAFGCGQDFEELTAGIGADRYVLPPQN
jgi:hypothetical protein